MEAAATKGKILMLLKFSIIWGTQTERAAVANLVPQQSGEKGSTSLALCSPIREATWDDPDNPKGQPLIPPVFPRQRDENITVRDTRERV
jgi:hypothetical protein